MKKSYDILKDHPVNLDRIKMGLHPQTRFGFGEWNKNRILTPTLKNSGFRGTVISAVDLIKGIGQCAGLNVVEIDGATGTVNTNFDGKAKAAIDALKGGDDFVYIHLEAADEAGTDTKLTIRSRR